MMKLIYTLSALICLSLTSFAQWSTDPATNTPVCTSANDQEEVAVAADGQGGAIMAWRDYRTNSGIFEGDIYARRINSRGELCWSTNGIVVNNQPNGQFRPKIISDGEGGAIMVWAANQGGFYNYNLYAQRVDSLGNLLWTSTGVPIAVGSATESFHEIIPDGNGGVIIVWQRLPSIGNPTDIYAQRVDAGGTVQWTTNGVAICLASQSQTYPKLVSDGAGGAIIVWDDGRAGLANTDIYAQKINGNGNVAWMTDGIPVCTDAAVQSIPEICSDGYGGAFIAWEDYRVLSGAVYGQRINDNGTPQWAANGIQISPAPDACSKPLICSDGDNGAILVWSIDRQMTDTDIGSQRIDGSGNNLWGTTGVSVCTANGNQAAYSVIPNDAGGVTVTWQDTRNGSLGDIYAQWIDRNGSVRWATNGVAISTATEAQNYPKLTGDLLAGAIIAWNDERSGSGADIYVQNIDYRGLLGTEGLFYRRSNLALAFNDTQPANDTLYIGGQELVKFQQPFDISVRIDRVTHDYVSDLEFTLTHLSVSDTLIYRVDGGGGVNFINTVLNDHLGMPFANGTAPFTGYFQPRNPLETFLSVPLNGEWILTITDHKAGDDGVLDGWGLFISQSTIVNIDDQENEITDGFVLYQNYPNPFNPVTTISWQLAVASDVTLEIYNLRGQKVKTLLSASLLSGSHSIEFNASGLASGIYFYRLQTIQFCDQKKMIILK